MAKTKTIYQCEGCGHQESKWVGRCPSCGQWNSLREEVQIKTKNPEASSSLFKGSGVLQPLNTIESEENIRYNAGFKEVNQVLGGGIVHGGAVLLGGEPGIGKSTLLMQIANFFSKEKQGKVLYVSGEESPSQIKMRADRLGVKESIEIYSGTDLDAVLATIKNVNPKLLIVDSAQTLYSNEAGSIPGTINQVKRCTHEIIGLCKEKNIASFIVAHVTKDGTIAGPKAIEHLVDTVLYFEQGDHELRLLRAVKNRFGAVDELGLFIMDELGLVETDLQRTATLFNRTLPAGVAIACTYEGSRVFFHEIQALTVPAKSGVSRVYSERIDSSRALRLAAVLERHVGIKLNDNDIYVNVSGGIRLTEPGIDLPLALAIYSARLGVALPQGLVSAGEIALSGEVRPAAQMGKRLKTAGDLGFKTFAGSTDDKTMQVINPSHIKELVEKVIVE